MINIIREPSVVIVGRQNFDRKALDDFLATNDLTWETDTEIGAEQMVEAGGRICYMSFGKGRKTNSEYIGHLMEMRHGSVLEHATWDFLITGVSRSFSHELVRHRAGWAYSQLSQRYVDESNTRYIEPEIIANDPALDDLWKYAVNTSHSVYCQLVEGLIAKIEARDRVKGTITNKTQKRKLARQAARSVLPNATETVIFCTANARALRHFIELRGSEGAEVEIRKVALKLLRLLRVEAPSIFGDYDIVTENGIEVIKTQNTKV